MTALESHMTITLSDDIKNIIYCKVVLSNLRSIVFHQLRCNRVYLEMQEESLRYDYTIDHKQYFNKINKIYANEGIIKPYIKIRMHLDESKLINSASIEAMRAYGLNYEFFDINRDNLSFQILYSGLDDLVFGMD
jgi:hypothetical protein